MKGWKETHQAHENPKRARIVLFISDKVDFEPKLVWRHTESHYVLPIITVGQVDATKYIYTPNVESSFK